MKANELRIGNWINHINKPIQCSIDTIYDFSKVVPPSIMYTPIPIAEQWLIDFGFEKAIENAGNLPCFKLGDITIAVWIKGKWQFWLGTKDIRKSPQYVHELQNLIFYLIGKELNLHNPK